MKRRWLWLCAQYRITHDDWIFRWIETTGKRPRHAGVAVFTQAPLVVYDDADPVVAANSIPVQVLEGG